MDTILLSISVYINSSMFLKQKQTSLKAASFLFRTGQDSSGLCASIVLANKHKNPTRNEDEVENKECISDAEVDNIVGVGDSSELEEMDLPAALLCKLRPYQKQALHWMIQLEKGKCMDEGAMTLHPCWEAYRLADKRGRIIYLNAFSGDATTEFPSKLQMARGGILGYAAMGLGKMIMTTALVAHAGHESSGSQPMSWSSGEDIEARDMSDHSSKLPKAVTKFSGFLRTMGDFTQLVGLEWFSMKRTQ